MQPTYLLHQGELRPRRPEDVDELYRLIDANRAHLEPWMPWVHGANREDSEAWLRNTDEIAWRVRDGRIAGTCALGRLDEANRSASVGYWLAAGAQGRGLATAIMPSTRCSPTNGKASGVRVSFFCGMSAALPVETMEADLRTLVDTIQCPHLRALLDRVFSGETWERFRTAPAAKHYHQAYAHGLLEHSLTVAQGVSALASTFGGIDRDVAVAGALVHDIGKLDAYATQPDGIEMTDLGKLQGEIPCGYYRVRREIENLPGFPEPTAAALLHIILAHHGQLEHGSPVVPCTREATLVHMIDNLGGRLGSFDRIERELPDGAQWSGFDRALSGSAFFADRAAA